MVWISAMNSRGSDESSVEPLHADAVVIRSPATRRAQMRIVRIEVVPVLLMSFTPGSIEMLQQ